MSDERFDALEAKIDKMDTKIDKIVDHTANTDVTLALNTKSLVDHMRRTELLENRVVPLEKYVVFVKTTMWLVAKSMIAVGGFAGFVLALVEIAKALK